jgi:hypothetical protein
LAKLLLVIPAGTNVLQPTEMIASRQFQEFQSEIARGYELVVIDSSPSYLWGQTTHGQARAGIDALAHLPKRPMGLVATGLASGSEGDYYGDYSSLNEGAAAA